MPKAAPRSSSLLKIKLSTLSLVAIATAVADKNRLRILKKQGIFHNVLRYMFWCTTDDNWQ
jgi:hypothetical protein